jgi:protein involved in polysaccharide export with SLBB domain
MRLMRQNLSRYVWPLCGLALAAMLPGCSLFSRGPSANPPHPAATANPFREDPLRIGDRVRVELTGIPDPILAGEQDVHEDGSINLPYINRVVANGKSPSQLEKEITAAYVPAYYTHIGVTVTPVARYFFVLGQVGGGGGSAGRILYTGPITLLGAIGAAGDFTPFADKRHVKVIHLDGTIKTVNCNKAITHPELDIPIYPGDKIQVGRRF